METEQEKAQRHLLWMNHIASTIQNMLAESQPNTQAILIHKKVLSNFVNRNYIVNSGVSLDIYNQTIDSANNFLNGN
jgi:hypothetical protein